MGNCLMNKPLDMKTQSPMQIHVQNNKFSSSAGNGVTGVYLSFETAQIVSDFWEANVTPMGMQAQLEIGYSILIRMMSINKDIKKIIFYKFEDHQYKIESLAVKFLDMIRYIIQHLLCTNIDLYSSLLSLGKIHTNMGIKLKDYNPMLQSIHQTFKCCFNQKYSAQVKSGINKVFTVAVRIMNEQIIKEQCFDFLQSLNTCLKTEVGREHLVGYLKEISKEDIVIFLNLLSNFKSQLTDRQRYIVAREIVQESIGENAQNQLNILDKTAENILIGMKIKTNLFLCEPGFRFSVNFFVDVEKEIHD
eukprot:471304_1